MLAQIRSFLTVVEEGSLHRAAARLHMSPSALSRQMQVRRSHPETDFKLVNLSPGQQRKILVVWRRGRAGGALKALLESFFGQMFVSASTHRDL
jgi:hypothetical protein